MKKLYKGLILLAVAPFVAACSSMTEEESYEHVMQVITGYQNKESGIDYSLNKHTVSKVLAHYARVKVEVEDKSSYEEKDYTITDEDKKAENYETYNAKTVKAQTVAAAHASLFGVASNKYAIDASGESATLIDAVFAARLVSAKTLMEEYAAFRKDESEVSKHPYSCNFSYDFDSGVTFVDYSLSYLKDIE